MGLFSGHRIIKENDGCIVVLYLDLSTEFAEELGRTSPEENKNLRDHVEDYIARNLSDLKIKAARIAMGSVVVVTLSLSPMNTGIASASPAAATSTQVYIVQQGDSLYKIANNFGVTIDELKQTNLLTSDQIYVGQSLKIPPLALPDGVYRTESTGSQIRMLQRVLASFGYGIKADGIYGPQTNNVILQLQKKFPLIKADGIYGPMTKASLQTLLDSQFHLGSNPTDILALVNRVNGLSADYVPPDLVQPKVPFTIQEAVPQKLMRKDAAQALEELFAKAAQDNISLMAVSGYRSYDRQSAIFARNIQISPEMAQFSARPGESEHQTGLAIDVSGLSSKYQLTQAFGDTPEGQWLKQNAPAFGFIIRYPKGKENITGYQYEPWHIRYVGKGSATLIMQQDLTLEEYAQNK